MKIINVNNVEILEDQTVDSPEISSPQFMGANTKEITVKELKEKSIIPVYAKDNESTISHSELIYSVQEVVNHAFKGEKILQPAIRVSHPVKGRIPEAMGKPVDQLKDSEKTIYFERMAFIIEIPSIIEDVNGNKLSLSVGGARAYNLENLYGRKSPERFKIFIGFKNMVCINLCISTDGYQSEIRVSNLYELFEKVFSLFTEFEFTKSLNFYRVLNDFSISESEFAKLVGRARMYQHLPAKVKKTIPELPLIDSQISLVTKEYYSNEHFNHDLSGYISLWKLYNLFTGANKSSYIDSFLDRNAGSYEFISTIKESIQHKSELWYLK